jgi:hypothetical protein
LAAFLAPIIGGGASGYLSTDREAQLRDIAGGLEILARWLGDDDDDRTCAELGDNLRALFPAIFPAGADFEPAALPPGG